MEHEQLCDWTGLPTICTQAVQFCHLHTAARVPSGMNALHDEDDPGFKCHTYTITWL